MEEKPRFWDTTLPFEERVDDLVSRMTLEEKVSQMMHDAPAIERLGDPGLQLVERVPARRGPRGHRHRLSPGHRPGRHLERRPDAPRGHGHLGRGARQAPRGPAQRQHPLIYTGLTFWSPNINIFRDPRWGRGQETYGEDPYLTARLGVAFVKGLQGDDPPAVPASWWPPPSTMPYTAARRPSAITFDARVSATRLCARPICPPLRPLCARPRPTRSWAPTTAPTARPAAPARPCCRISCASEWGFDGYVVSDCGAIDDIYATPQGGQRPPEEAAALAVKDGCDLNCGETYLALLRGGGAGADRRGDLDRP